MTASPRKSPGTFRRAFAACTLAASLISSAVDCKAEDINIEALLKEYQTVESVSCSVRKTSMAAGQTVRMLSRVHYRKGGFIHVENVSPSRRRVIADGKSLYYNDSNSKKGFSRPIDKLDEDWTTSLVTVPGSPVDHLLKMKAMQPGNQKNDGDLRTRAFHGEKNHVVLTIDSKGRVLSLEFYKDAELRDQYASYKYSDFIKAGNAWLAQKHEAEILLPDGSKATEVRQFDNLSVNAEVPDKLFDHNLFMQDVEFVSDFGDTLE